MWEPPPHPEDNNGSFFLLPRLRQMAIRVASDSVPMATPMPLCCGGGYFLALREVLCWDWLRASRRRGLDGFLLDGMCPVLGPSLISSNHSRVR